MVGRSAGRAIPVLLPAVVVAVFALTGCHVAVNAGSRTPGSPPRTEQPCTAMQPPVTPNPTPISTKLPWRSATMPDGSIRMTVGDIDAAPAVQGATALADYRAPGDRIECQEVRILRARGWWCTTTVGKIAEQGEIVVGGAQPRARVRSLAHPAFRTVCGGHVPKVRQHYSVERDSWSGWRDYSRRAFTPWTTARTRSGPPVTTPCPAGRVGTYNYRLAVTVEVDGYTVDPSEAAGPTIRADCGTGTS